VVVGLPDAGQVCKDKHSPDFLAQVGQFKAEGFTQVLMASVGTAKKLGEFAQAINCTSPAVRFAVHLLSRAKVKTLRDSGQKTQERRGERVSGQAILRCS